MPHASFTSTEDLAAYVANASKEAVMQTGEELLKIFIEEYVDTYAYGGAVTGEWYNPTGQFRAAWRKKTEQLYPYMWQVKIYYNPNGVMYDNPERWQHYSNFSHWGSAISYMDEMLNVKGVVGIMGIGENGSTWSWNFREEAYFDKFMEDYIDSGEAERMLAANMVL